MLALSLAIVLTAAKGAPPSAVPPAAQARYQDAVAKLGARQYGPANDVLNALAAEFPRIAEIFASRCSAQLGLQHWAAAEADCRYTLQLKPIATAIYGLGVAEDGQHKAALAAAHYREYAAHKDALPQLKDQALARAAVIAPAAAGTAVAQRPTNELDVAPPPPPPPPPKKEEAPPPPPVTPAASAKGQFVPGIPDPNEHILYVYRNILSGVGTNTVLYVDNVAIGDLWNDHYYEVRVKPGGHDVTIKPEDSLRVNVEEGEISYLKLERGQGETFKLKLVGKEGRKEIREHCELRGSKKL